MNCPVCTSALGTSGDQTPSAQAIRHHHFLKDFNDADTLRQHLVSNNDEDWTRSGGADAAVRWWLSKKFGNLR